MGVSRKYLHRILAGDPHEGQDCFMNSVQPNAAFDAACRTSEGFGRAILTYVYLGLGC